MIEKVALAGCIALATGAAFGQEMTEFDSERVQRVAELLIEKAAGIKSPQVKIEPDVAKAAGLRFRNDGIVIVPQKGLSEDAENADVDTERGAALGYLFMSSGFGPVVDGKRSEAEKLRTMKVVDNQGDEDTVRCFLLTVRRIHEEDWRLYVYGCEKKPLLDAQFSEAAEEKPGLVALDVGDVAGHEGALTITVFGKYQAGFRIGYQMD
jgi:hypothetical protein